MWKLLQCVPRAVRAQWGTSVRPAPQTTCREDNRVDASPQSIVVQYSNQDGHRHRNNEETGAEREWFRQHVHFGHCALDAVHLGTILVLGIQVSHLWYFYTHDRNSQHHHEQRNRLCRLYQLAISMPRSHNISLSRNIFPAITPALAPAITPEQTADNTIPELVSAEHILEESESSSCDEASLISEELIFPLPEPPSSFYQLEEPNSLTSEHFSDSSFSFSSSTSSSSSSSFSSTSSSSDASSTSCDSTNTVDPSTFNFESEWEQLSQTYYGIYGNETGLGYARTGDFVTAFRNWKKTSEETGYAKVNYNMGVCYETGKGTNRDFAKAAEYYAKAAASGHATAAYNLAVLHIQGNVDGSNSCTETLLHQAAVGGVVPAMRELGVRRVEIGEEKEGVKWLCKAVEEEDADSLYYLAVCYEHGLGIQQDAVRAVALYQQASELGHSHALYTLGELALDGHAGMSQDTQKALNYFRQAYRKGYGAAQQKIQQIQQQLQHERFDDVLAKHGITTESNSLTMSRSSPSLSHSLQRHLTDVSVNNWGINLIEQQSKNLCAKPQANQSRQSIWKSASASSLLSLQLQLLLGRNVTNLNEVKSTRSPENCTMVDKTDKTSSVLFQIGDASTDGDSSDIMDTYDLAGGFGDEISPADDSADTMGAIGFTGGGFGDACLCKDN